MWNVSGWTVRRKGNEWRPCRHHPARGLSRMRFRQIHRSPIRLLNLLGGFVSRAIRLNLKRSPSRPSLQWMRPPGRNRKRPGGVVNGWRPCRHRPARGLSRMRFRQIHRSPIRLLNLLGGFVSRAIRLDLKRSPSRPSLQWIRPPGRNRKLPGGVVGERSLQPPRTSRWPNLRWFGVVPPGGLGGDVPLNPRWRPRSGVARG